MKSWQRFQVVEYAKPAALADEIAKKCDVSVTKARELLLGASNRVRGLLGLDATPISINGDLIQFQNFAGLLVLAPGLELEVAPKFLGNAPGWREDFFLLATLSHHGRLLDNEGLKAASHATSDLATLIGRSLVEMYWRNQRRPLRKYRQLHQTDFAIDGDFNPEDLMTPSEQGFEQHFTSFTRVNSFNAVIRAAADQLSQIVPDAETRARLERVAQHLPRQGIPLRLKQEKLSNRARNWQPTYDLSLDILRGLGGVYDASNALAPGFVMQTWQVWEHLIAVSLRSGFGGKNVTVQSKQLLGRRFFESKSSPLNVFPDTLVSIHSADGERLVIVDAKYKDHVDRGTLAVSSADIYEALAFSRATSVKDLVLAYPRSFDTAEPSKNYVGYAAEFSRITVDDITIRAIELGVSGISNRGGIIKLTDALSNLL